MKPLFRLAALFVLIFGLRNSTQAGSLEGNTETFQNYASSPDPSGFLQFAKAVHSTRHVAEDTSQTVSLLDGSGTFAEFYTGYDYSILGDLSTGFNNFKSEFLASSSAYSATGGGFQNSGIQTGVIYGIHLDPSSSLALEFSNVMTFPSDYSISGGSTVLYNTSLAPSLFSVSADYSLNLIQAGSSRTYVAVSGGYYHGTVAYNNNGGGYGGGTFTGDNIGGTLGIGEEVSLGSGFGFNFSLPGRYAYFSQVSSTTAVGLSGGTGTTYLCLAGIGGPNNLKILVPASSSLISKNPSLVSYAGLDYSGLDAHAAVEYHFF